ncbi:MAG: hypothetical protein WEA04_05055 [Candidatus Andersenbacteria bacterium]
MPSEKKGLPVPADSQPGEGKPPLPGNLTTPPGQSEEAVLSQLKRELYARDESKTITNRGEELHHLGIRRQVLPPAIVSKEEPTVAFESLITKRAKRRRRVLLGAGGISLLIFLFGSAVAGTLWYRLRQTVKQEQIRVELTAPTEFTTGETITYRAQLRNDSYVDWENVELVFEPPRGFRYRESSHELQRNNKQYTATLNTLASGQEATVEINGQLLGEHNASLVARAEVVFTPKNFPSGRFTKSTLATTVITLVPIDVAIDATDEAQSGERLLVTVQVRNNSPNTLEGAYLRINPAPGMEVAPEDAQFSPGFSVVDSRWELGVLEPLANVQRQLVVYVEGEPSERRTLDVELGIQDGEEEFIQRSVAHLITITASALAVEQVYNDQSNSLIVTPEERISGVIRYTNIGTGGLKNVVIKVAFEGTGIDPASLRLPAGAYDPTTRTITWTAASVSALATVQPRQEGSVSYEFQILPAAGFPTSGDDAKNNVLTAIATIDSPDLITPTGQQRNLVSDRSVLSIATTLSLETDAFYDDGRLGIESSGPLPPRAGEQTTYTLRFRLGSTLNDMGDVKLVAVLPDGVRYMDKIYKTAGEVTFNERTGEIIWTLPTLAGLTARALPGEELQAQIAITPAEHQRGQSITFLNRLTAEGTDLFTENSIQTQITSFPTTETAVRNKGTVE